MDLVDRIKKDIDDRLAELRPQTEEIPQREAALAALEAGGEADAGQRGARPRGRPRRRAGASRARGAGGRARRGQRREELLQLIKGHPEITLAEAARQIGVSPRQVSTLVRRLPEEGVLERADGCFVVVEPAAAASEEAAGAEGDAPVAAEQEDPADAEPAPPEAEEVQGPGVEGLGAPAADGDEEADAPEPARDEAGRPQAT